MNEFIDRLAIITVAGSQTEALTHRLAGDGFYFTRVDSSGGLLHESTAALLIGLHQSRLPQLQQHLHACCKRRRQLVAAQVEILPLQMQPPMIEVEIGGAILYLLPVERFEQI